MVPQLCEVSCGQRQIISNDSGTEAAKGFCCVGNTLNMDGSDSKDLDWLE